MPVPAPTQPCATASAAGGVVRRLAERAVRGGPHVAAAAEVEDDRTRHDRHDGAGIADRVAETGVGQPAYDTVGGREAEGAAAAHDDRLHALDEVARVEQVGLAGARSATTHVDTADRSGDRREHHGRPGQPAVADPLVVPHADALDVDEAVRRSRPHDDAPVRNRRAVSA